MTNRIFVKNLNSRDPVDFMRCREEFLKLIKQDKMSIADKWQYSRSMMML